MAKVYASWYQVVFFAAVGVFVLIMTYQTPDFPAVAGLLLSAFAYLLLSALRIIPMYELKEAQ